MRGGVLLVIAVALAGAALAGGAGGSTGSRTSITVWAAAPPVVTAYGGASYGGYVPPTGAMITEQREVELAASGDVKLAGVAATLDPASVQLRDLTDPAGTVVREQRFVPGATTPDEILARHVGEQVAVATAKGEIDGVLRAVDAQALVVEVGAGDQRRLQLLQRDGFVHEVRLAAGTGVDKPSLVWKLAAKKPGKHALEVTYRAEGMVWSADYLAVLDEAARTIDFSARATVKNLTGATFDSAEVVLAAGGGGAVMPAASPYGVAPQRATTAPQRFAIATPIRLAAGDAVQVELFPSRVGAKARSVVTFEAMPDPSAAFQAYPATDCNQWNATNAGSARVELAVELDVPSTGPLPEGRVRMFRRKADKLDMLSDDQLRSSAGVARIRLAPATDLTGERKAAACTFDERSRTLHEKVEVKLENKGKHPADVVVREFLWRWPVWRIDPADETIAGTRAGTQTQEYRVAMPAGAKKKTLAYTVTYTW